MTNLNRRTILRGAGAFMSLPLMEAMIPNKAHALAAAGTANTKRVGFIFFPNGAIMKDWTPGDNLDKLPDTLSPLKNLKEDIAVVSGLAHDKSRANGDGAGDHARSSATFLTASQAKKTGGADIYVGTSIDQIIASQIGKETTLPSIELGLEPGRQAGKCDSGYSCAYQGTISWKTPTQPVPKEIVPRLAFERLFGQPGDREELKKKNFYRKSILDIVASDAKKLNAKLGSSDRRKIDEYFTSVREIEKRIDGAEHNKILDIPEFKAPTGVPSDVVEHTRLMYDIMHLAYLTDSTRVTTLMLGNSGSNRRYSHLGIKEGHHQLSHHRNNDSKVAMLQKIDKFMIEEFARFLQKMKQTKEGDGNLLDNSIFVYGSSLSDANRHRHEDLPVILAGHGGGDIKTNTHLKVKKETPMANLFLNIAESTGVTLPRFGDSTGKLSGLS